MNEQIQEYCDSRGVAMRVDRSAGVIRGVKILGRHSRNGREYLPETLRRASALYEGAKVNVNHAKGSPLAPRDYQDRLGVIRGVEVRGDDGLFGDLHFNPKHTLAEQLIWDAEHAPENVGFSHNVQARTARRDELLVVEEITRVESVDLVADPATTRGLFEAAVVDRGAWTVDREGQLDGLTEATGEQLRAEIARLREQIDRLEAERTAGLVEQNIAQELSASGMPAYLVTDLFRQQLRGAATAEARRQLILERVQIARAAGSIRPTSKDQHLVEASGAPRLPADAKSFAERITA